MAGASLRCQLQAPNAVTTGAQGSFCASDSRYGLVHSGGFRADYCAFPLAGYEGLWRSGKQSLGKQTTGWRPKSLISKAGDLELRRRTVLGIPCVHFGLDTRSRKCGNGPVECTLGDSGDASAFQLSSDRPEFEQPLSCKEGQSDTRFDPLSLSNDLHRPPTEKPDRSRTTVVLQLSAALCLALIIAARHPPQSSNFLCLSLSTAPETGPSALRAFHPLVQTAWTGLVTGCLHTMTGPDHLASLAPLTIGRSRAQSALLGAMWGAGHGSGQLLLGSIFLLFKENIEHLLPLLSRWSGTLVGLILVLIGAHGLRESLLPIEEEAMEFTSYLGTYINGFTFGLQPDALMMILPALALPSRAAAASFLGAFLLGTILAMGTYSGCIGAASEALGKRMPWLTQRLSQISGIIAMALGVFFVVTNVLGL